MYGKIAAALAALTLVASPLAAQPAQKLSLAQAAKRSGASTADENRLFGLSPVLTIVGAIVAGLVVWQIIENVDGNDDEPASS